MLFYYFKIIKKKALKFYVYQKYYKTKNLINNNFFKIKFRFDVHQKCFFTRAIRSRIVQFILDRKRFTLGIEDDYAFGIDRLISEEVYIAAYPLHDVRILSIYDY